MTVRAVRAGPVAAIKAVMLPHPQSMFVVVLGVVIEQRVKVDVLSAQVEQT